MNNPLSVCLLYCVFMHAVEVGCEHVSRVMCLFAVCAHAVCVPVGAHKFMITG